MPPLSHQQLAAAVLMFHRPFRTSPIHDAHRLQPGTYSRSPVPFFLFSTASQH
ncbi:BZ3501_MvSof-1269-A2-R1_Chr10-2g02406 [Microbotryum saponariae]|nr:BZ3501_MvSof-1269-A2-R1_Chr10-2g02406 [Microbotryum saponariae]